MRIASWGSCRRGAIAAALPMAMMVATVGGCGNSTSETMFPDPARATGGAGGSGGSATGGSGGSGGSATAGSTGTGGSTSGTGGASATGGSTGSGGSTGTGGSGAGDSGAPGTGGSGAGTGGSGMPGTGGSGAGTGGSGPAAGACPGGAYAIAITMDVTWPSTTAAAAGMGKIFLWNKSTVSPTGDAVAGMLQGCGTVLPETGLTSLGRIAAGGTKILIEVPEDVWDKPSMPKFPVTGMQAGGATGTFNLSWAVLLGATLGDPKGPWPDSYTGLMGADADGDGKPGYIAAPRNGGGFVLPPTAVGIGGSAPSAERLFLVSRHVVTINGTRTSCDELSGPASVSAFDSHVMGCLLRGGGECNKGQTDFVDGNRMKYVVKSATFRAKKVGDAATCAEVRAALPPN
jgi:hypothetical protein